MTPIWLALAFAVGVLCGVLWREAFELLRQKDEWMRLKSVITRIRSLDALMLALVFSLLLCAGTGVSIIVNSHNQGRVVSCFSRYNTLSGNARDERAAATMKAGNAELAYVRQSLLYQQGLLDALRQGKPVTTLESVVAAQIKANQAYLDTLNAQRKVREREPYPNPNFCGGPTA